jgi:pilus assembly protein Flp/PilA
MHRLRTQMKRFVASEGGATAIEYGLICAMIAVVLLGSLAATGGAVSALYDKLSAIATAFVGGSSSGGSGSGS